MLLNIQTPQSSDYPDSIFYFFKYILFFFLFQEYHVERIEIFTNRFLHFGLLCIYLQKVLFLFLSSNKWFLTIVFSLWVILFIFENNFAQTTNKKKRKEKYIPFLLFFCLFLSILQSEWLKTFIFTFLFVVVSHR